MTETLGAAQVGSDREASIVRTKSNRPTMATSVVSLNRPMKVETMPGITIRSACGRTMKPIVCQVPRPSDFAPSYWPLGIAWRPPRTTSAM